MSTTETTEQFSLTPFLYQNGLTLAFIFVIIKIIAPELWQLQLSAPWQLFVLTFLVIHLIAAFIEYFFHRYVLHMDIIPGFSHFYQQHNLHHDHTSIEQDNRMYVSNVFPIVDESQFEASFFPWWTLLAFSLLLTPFFIIIAVLFPSVPVFSAGYIALLFSMMLYELFHAAWHWPLETWNKLFKQKYFGGLWNTVYTFHLRHHADVRCNESVSGFFGIPVPDIMFMTYIKPDTRYPHREIVNPCEFDTPTPIFFIRWLDEILAKLNKEAGD